MAERADSLRKRFRQLAELAPDPALLLAAGGEIVEASPAAAALVGLEPAALRDRPLRSLCPPEEAGSVERALARAWSLGAGQLDVPLRGAGGAVVHVEVALRVVGGAPPLATAALRDVTARRQEEARLRLAFDESPDGVTLTRIEDGVVVAVNETLLRRHGLLEEQVIGRSMVQLGLWADPAERQWMVEQLRRDGVVRDLDVHFRRHDGSIGILCCNARRVALAGEPLIVTVSRDVTAERAMARRLADGERRFRALLERSSDLIFLLDRERRFQFWSPSATEALGWTAEEMLGRAAEELELVHPEDRERMRALTEAANRRPGSSLKVLLRHRHKDGSWRLLDCWGRNLVDDPAVQGVVVNARDVTEQHALEEQLRQAQKLESVGRLAGGVAHDLNNILTVILSCSHALQDELAEAGVGGEAAEDAAEIRAAGERARELTSRLLAFARGQVIAPEPQDLSEVVRASEGALRGVLGDGVRLALELEPAPWPVRCDRGQLEQALTSLAVNAREAMPEGGTLTVVTRNHRSGQVVLAVRDTGLGMSEEVRAHLFEPFYTTKPLGRGTGLGLATVYGIVRQAGGTVEVDTAPGRGTAFELRFPRASAAAARPAPAPAARPGRDLSGTETVLVVEDEPQVRAVTARILAGAGYRVLQGGGGAEALEAARRLSERPDLVVADAAMPGRSGPGLVEALRARWPGLRALYLAGYTGDVAAWPGGAAGGFPLLAKPFTPAGLLERVRAVLDGP